MVITDVAPDTAQLLRGLVVGYRDAVRSACDEDLLAVSSAATAALAAGVIHDDLRQLVAQIQLDSHDLAAAERTLEGSTGDGARHLHASLLRQRGCFAAAARCLLGETAIDETADSRPSGRVLAGVAGLYDDLGAVAQADGWYAAAVADLDAKQVALLAWIEVQRSRLRRTTGDLEAAARHLNVAERAGGGWAAAVERARWWQAGGEDREALRGWSAIVRSTGRPDHRHAMGSALARLGRTAEAAAVFAATDVGYRLHEAALPFRYLHHRVVWHQEVDGDLDAALELALRDRTARPNPHTGGRLLAVLRSRGETRAAADLDLELERRRRSALAELASL